MRLPKTRWKNLEVGARTTTSVHSQSSAQELPDIAVRAGLDHGHRASLCVLVLLYAALGAVLAGCSRGERQGKTPSPQRGKGMPVPVAVAVAGQKHVPVQLQA